MKIARILTSSVIVSTLISFNATAAVECAPQVTSLISTNPVYSNLNSVLTPNLAQLKTKLDAVKDQASYVKLLTAVHTIAKSVVNGRLVITLPDGTVVADTSKPDDPGNTKAQGNSFLHFKNKTINENLNTRISNLHSQLHVCGLGVETRFSTTDNVEESFVAIRLGPYLDSSGTARISKKL